MTTNKQVKRNWNEDDLIILIWCIVRYTEQKNKTYKDVDDEDWKFIAQMVPGKTDQSCKFKWLSMCKTNIQIAPWTKEENELLDTLVKQKGKKAWQEISKELYKLNKQKIYRSSKQCREHYNNHLDPNVRRGTWNKQEDLELLRLAQQIGKKWSVIAKKLNGRTENAVKNRYHAIFRKEIERKEALLHLQRDGKSDYMPNEREIEDEQFYPASNAESEMIEASNKAEYFMVNKLISNLEKQLHISPNLSGGDYLPEYGAQSLNLKSKKKIKMHTGGKKNDTPLSSQNIMSSSERMGSANKMEDSITGKPLQNPNNIYQ